MNEEYGKLKKLLEDLGYEDFTALQEDAFRKPDICVKNRNVFVVGETSSGKTLIPFLLDCKEFDEAVRQHKPRPKMIYAVPYRALAAQKQDEFTRLAQKLIIAPTKDLIVQSTGEVYEYDNNIINGEVDIAIVITEKLYRFICHNDTMLDHYQFLVVDEVGLLNSDDRGCKIDFIFALTHQHYLRRNQKPDTADFRIMALGTPFYNWEQYIENYDFLKVSAEGRPVKLEYCRLEYTKRRITSVTPESEVIHPLLYATPADQMYVPANPELGPRCPVTQELCPRDQPPRHNSGMFCPSVGKSCPCPVEYVQGGFQNIALMCAKICRWHLERKHQILIFVNDREKVRDLAVQLYHLLKDVLKPQMTDPRACKEFFLRETVNKEGKITRHLDVDEDDLQGIFDDEHYAALFAKVAFHSAALPPEVRRFIEDNFLLNRNLKIVCSTETLAFGINSNVDAVIIADIYKNASARNRFLTRNEFQNYAGRAGRLKPGRGEDQYGYVYTFLKQDPDKIEARRRWYDDMIRTPDYIPPLTSHFFPHENNTGNSMLPFFLLTILQPNTSMSFSDLIDTLSILPRPDSWGDRRMNDLCAEAIEKLEEQQLIIQNISFFPGGASYQLTHNGAALRGYIIGFQDYEILLDILSDRRVISFNSENNSFELDSFSLLQGLIDVPYIDNTYDNFFRKNSKKDATMEERFTEEKIQNIFSAFDHETSRRLKAYYENTRDIGSLFLLAALLDWMRSENLGHLYSRYRIAYPLIQNLSIQICYLVEVCRSILPNLYAADYPDASAQLDAEMYTLWTSLRYGINPSTYSRLMEFMKKNDIGRYQNWKKVDLNNSRTLRRIMARYQYFDMLRQGFASPVQDADTLKKLYQNDIRKIGTALDEFFIQSFGSLYTDS